MKNVRFSIRYLCLASIMIPSLMINIPNSSASPISSGNVLRASGIFRVAPTETRAPATMWKMIATGSNGSTTCGITSKGGAYCWGSNNYGALGGDHYPSSGLYYSSKVPEQVWGLSSGVTSIGVGDDFACALTKLGDVYCWGHNDQWQLGDNGHFGVGVDVPFPEKIGGFDGPVKSISVGMTNSCAITTKKTLYCWGAHGSLNKIGDWFGASEPSRVVLLEGDTAVVSSGANHTCAVTVLGSAFCWGRNDNGQLGNGTNSLDTSGPVSGLLHDVVGISAGGNHSCALKGNGRMYCWGSNEFGQLGTGDKKSSLVPREVKWLKAKVDSVFAGNNYTCAITAAKVAICWGQGMNGSLGYVSSLGSTAPQIVKDLRSNIGQLSASVNGSQTCATTTSGLSYCWGVSFLRPKDKLSPKDLAAPQLIAKPKI
jgi:alpha-tubulin suppressor-like RCC1 family protein